MLPAGASDWTIDPVSRPNRDIVLLVYLNRSGSTYLANQLSAHPALAVAPEGHGPIERLLLSQDGSDVDEIRLQLERDILEDEKLSSWRIDRAVWNERSTNATDRLDLFYSLCESFADCHAPLASTVAVKGNFLRELILREGFDALQRDRTVRAIFLMRDPRAMFASQRRSISSRSGRPMQDNPLVAALRWREAAGIAQQLTAGAHGVTLRYEDLIQSQDETLTEVAAFLQIDGEAFGSSDGGAARLEGLIPDTQKHLHANIGKGPLAARISSWTSEITPSETRAIEAIAGGAMHGLGYEPAHCGALKFADLAPIARWVGVAAGRLLRPRG